MDLGKSQAAIRFYTKGDPFASPTQGLCCVSLYRQVVIRRRPLFYAVSLLLPSVFLMVMDIVGFYLPPDSGERVSFKITLLLGYSVFLIIVSDTLPATAIGTPLIGKVTVCWLLVQKRKEKHLSPEHAKMVSGPRLKEIFNKLDKCPGRATQEHDAPTPFLLGRVNQPIILSIQSEDETNG